MNYDPELNRLVKGTMADMVRNAERAGRDDLAGLICHYCGQTSTETALSRCSCSFPEAFGCGVGGRRICGVCEQAHRAVASHLERMFALPHVNRVNSRRFRSWRELSRAVLDLYPEDAEGESRALFTELAQVDEWDGETFRRDVLTCFTNAKFLDFQSLAKNLKEQETESMLRSIVRSGLLR